MRIIVNGNLIFEGNPLELLRKTVVFKYPNLVNFSIKFIEEYHPSKNRFLCLLSFIHDKS